MANREMKLLTDEQMKAFIRDGVLKLKTDFSNEFHARLIEQLDKVHAEEGNPGNNILPRIREMQKVFDHPVITGALTSVLGPDYLLHTHRHCHFNAAPDPGKWHKDSYWGYQKIRNHRPWWAMIMYFPQDTPTELGPTGVLPGSHIHETRTFLEDDIAEEMTAKGEAGTFVLIHYDIWHRSTRNTLGQPRYMLKFEFMRTTAPTVPSWDSRSREWSEDGELAPGYQALDAWNWLHGEIGGSYGSHGADLAAIHQLSEKLTGKDEPAAVEAAYELAIYGEAGKAVLLETLRSEDRRASLAAAYGLTACGEAAVDDLTAALDAEQEHTVNHALFALGELRQYAAPAVPAIVHSLGSLPTRLRRTAADSLGLIGGASEQSVDGLIAALRDEDEQVRFTAGLSLAQLGKAAEKAIPALAEALDDENRYVRGHAIEALRYIDTEEARDILLHELIQSRWCVSTTKASTF